MYCTVDLRFRGMESKRLGVMFLSYRMYSKPIPIVNCQSVSDPLDMQASPISRPAHHPASIGKNCQ